MTVQELMDAHGRCRVCGLPLPKDGEPGVCSRRCAGLRKEAEACARAHGEWEDLVLKELANLSRESTMCPGELCQRLMPGTEKPIGILRPLLFYMAERGRIRVSQKGRVIPWFKIRGPFRVGVKK